VSLEALKWNCCRVEIYAGFSQFLCPTISSECSSGRGGKKFKIKYINRNNFSTFCTCKFSNWLNAPNERRGKSCENGLGENRGGKMCGRPKKKAGWFAGGVALLLKVVLMDSFSRFLRQVNKFPLFFCIYKIMVENYGGIWNLHRLWESLWGGPENFRTSWENRYSICLSLSFHQSEYFCIAVGVFYFIRFMVFKR